MTIARESATWLLNEFNRRKSKNPSFSLRAFAKYLRLSPSRLSELLSSKRTLTKTTALQIADRLEFSPLQKEKFLEAVSNDYEATRIRKRKQNIFSPTIQADFYELSEDAFAAISDPIHFSLLSLAETKNFKSDEGWIARRLKISTMKVRETVSRLSKLGLLQEKNGKLSCTHYNLTTTHDIPSSALRKGHAELLGKAIEAIQNVPVEKRDVTSVTMAVDPKKLEKAKKMIKEFRRKLMKELESGEKTEVFALAIQLFPLTEMEKKK